MRLDITRYDHQLIDFALANVPAGTRQRKEDLEKLRLRIQAQCSPSQVPKRHTFPTPIRSAWPSGDVKRTPKPDGFFNSDEQRKVKLNNSMAQSREARVNDILKGLI